MKLGKILLSGLLIFLFSISVSAKEKSYKDFTLKDYDGKEHSLSQYQDSKAIVVMFIATRCAVSNAYNSRMLELYDDYKDKGVTFLGINSNKQEGINEIKSHATKNEFKFPVLKDTNNLIADRFEASYTPEIYVLSSDFKLLYHGRIDDSQREDKVKKQDLRVALDQILAGKEVRISETKAFGCTIKRVSQ